MLQNTPGPVDPGALTGVGRTVAVPDRALDLAGTGPQPAAVPGAAGTLPPAIALTAPAGPGAAATTKPSLKAPGGAKPLAAAGAPDLTKDGKAAGTQQPGAAQEAAGAGGTKSAQRTPGADPKFQVLKKDVATKKRAVGTSHPPASAEAGSAQAAAVPPKDDQEARGKVTHAGEMDAAQPKEFDREAFVKAVEEAIARKAPQNLEEADEFGDSGKAEEVKGEVQGKVGAGKDASAAEIETTTAEVPTPAPDAKTVVPMTADRPPSRPAGPNPDLAAPDNLPPDATDLSAGPEQVGQQMADANVTKQQIALPNSKEPSFGKAIQETDKLEKHSEAAPAALRGAENREIKAVKSAAGAQGQAAMGAMHGTRVGTGQQVTAGKTGAKSTDEQKRAQVTAKLQAVFDTTKTDVEKILDNLDDKVDKQFTDEEKAARNRFVRDHKEGMRRYKAERYSGFWGPGKWLKDKFLPLPDEANRIYERARDAYIAAMKQVIIRISYTVESSLRQAKDRISLGRTQLTATVEALPADLKAIGQSAAAEFADRFTELQDTVNEKGTELVQTVADRYTEAVKQIDDLIAKEKEKNKGLLAKAVDAVKGVIDAIIELKNMLMGMLRKAVAAIGAILKDPIGFLKNLISAVGGGLKLFMKNIGKHMQAGVLQWLLGTASSVGLQLPAKFDTQGIVQVLAMLMGLSWANIRGRITRKAPEPAVRAAETGVPLVAAVKKQGVGGMWSDLKSRVGDLKKDLISKVVKYLTPTIIIAGITWILSLLNPASAFIRACKMIIDIVRFIVTQGRQIIEFVNSVLDAVLAIARGGAGGVPGLVERALARSIPVLIGALAAILGIGGIAGKVKQIFQTLSKPVNRAVDWVIGKIVGLIKKLWAKLKAKKPKKPERPRRPKRPRDRDRRRRRPSRQRPGTPRRSRKPGERPDPQRKKDDKPAKGAVAAALREAVALVRPDASVDAIKRRLDPIRRKHKIKQLSLIIEQFGPSNTTLRFAGLNSPEEKSGPVNIWHKTYDGIRHLVELTKGIPKLVTKTTLLSDEVSYVELLEFRTGQRAVRKVPLDQSGEIASLGTPGPRHTSSQRRHIESERAYLRTADERADAERLGYVVARAVGANVPPAFRYSQTELLMDFVEGTSGNTMQTDLSARQRVARTPAARRIGLLDILIGNEDRHSGNWILVDGEAVGIDQGEAWSEHGKNLADWIHKDFARTYYDFKNGHWIKNNLDPADIDRLELALRALRPEFEPSRQAWYDEMMERFAQVKRHSRWGS